MPDDLTDLVPDPGTIAGGGSNASASNTGPDIALLEPSFTPDLSNLLNPASTAQPTSAMGEIPVIDLGITPDGGFDNSGGSNPLDTSNLGTTFLNDVSGIGSSLLNAFVINPQNAQTQQQSALVSAGITSAQTSQIFSYLFIGLIIFLVFGLLKKA